MIDGPAGRLPEGHKDHPWEQEAIAAEEKYEMSILQPYRYPSKGF